MRSVAILLVLAACHWPPPAAPKPEPPVSVPPVIADSPDVTASLTPPDQAPVIPADLELRMRRSDCYGECPTYRITLTADGGLVYEGETFVTVVGRASGRIDVSHVRAILAAFDDLLRTEAIGPALCVGGSDMPGVHVDVRRDGTQTSLSSRDICQQSERWMAMFRFAAQVEALAGLHRWVGGEPR